MGRCAHVVAPFAATVICGVRIACAAESDIPALERAVEADPASVSARLQLARAYYASGRVADAKILFDTVLRFEKLPTDVKSQTELYAHAAERYLKPDDGMEGRFVGFNFAEAGIGGYTVNSSPDTG